MTTTAETRCSDQTTSLARGASLNLMGSVSKSVLAGLLLWALSRGFGASAAGAFIEAIGVFAILTAVGLLGVDVGLLRSVSLGLARGHSPQRMARLLQIGLIPVAVVSTLLGVGLFVAADAVAELVGNGAHVADIARYLRGLVPFLPFASLSLALLGGTRGHEDMLPTVAVDQSTKLGLQCLGVGLVAWVGQPSLTTAWGVPVVMACVASAWWLRRLWRDGRMVNDESNDQLVAPDVEVGIQAEAKEFWSFTLPRAMSNVFQIGVQWFDVLLVGGLLTTRDAAIYAVSTRMISFGLAAAQALGTVSQPMLGRFVARGQISRLHELFETTTVWQILVAWPQYVAVILTAPVLLSLFGPEYSRGAAVVIVLALAALAATGAGPVDMVLLMAGKSTWTMWNTAAALTLNVALNFLLVPRMGILGAAIAWGSARILSNILPTWQSWRFLGVHPFGSAWSRAMTVVIVAWAAVGGMIALSWGLDTLPAVAVYASVALAVYVVLVLTSRRALHLDEVMATLTRRFRRRRPPLRARRPGIPTIPDPTLPERSSHA